MSARGNWTGVYLDGSDTFSSIVVYINGSYKITVSNRGINTFAAALQE